MEVTEGGSCFPQTKHCLNIDLAENAFEKQVRPRMAERAKASVHSEETHGVIAGSQIKLPLMCKSHLIGLRWNAIFLHRVNLHPEKYVFLTTFKPKGNWPPEPNRHLGTAGSQEDSTHDFRFSFA